jgi:hypothetical protein
MERGYGPLSQQFRAQACPTELLRNRLILVEVVVVIPDTYHEFSSGEFAARAQRNVNRRFDKVDFHLP